MSRYVVTTSAEGATRTLIWNPAEPLTLGHPLRWVIESTDDGIRLRKISSQLNTIEKNPVHEISYKKLAKGAELELSQISFKIRPAEEVLPVYTHTGGNILTAYACIGNWILDAAKVDSSYAGRIPHGINGIEAFRIKKKSDSYTLRARGEDLDVNGKKLKSGETLELTGAQLADAVIARDAHIWRFGFVDAPAISPAHVTQLKKDLENSRFNRILVYTGLGLLALLMLLWFWPKPDTEELVPPQLAKIIMTQLPKTMTSNTPQAAGGASALPKRVQDAAVVQAFRAKALQSAISGLLKGGMTKLLTQSDFAAGTSASSDAKKLFDAKTGGLRSTAPGQDLMVEKNVNVAELGGNAVAGGKGYGKGEHAGVSGQGDAFVSMDVGGASVDEGLTKDEVGEVIHRHLSEVRYCYESAMVRTTDSVEGKLMVAFTIGGTGMVKVSDVKSSTLPDPKLDDCILRRLNSWKFPEPRGHVDVAVTYPFIFKTLGK